jgi:peptidyl-dipeptidase A
VAINEESMMLCCRLLLALAVAVAILYGCPRAILASPEATERARKLLKDYEDRIRPLEKAAALAWWNANVSGKDEDFQKKIDTQNRIDEALANAEAFRAIKTAREEGGIDDPITARAVEVIYLAYLEKQVDPALLKQMVAKANAVEKTFNAFRAKVDGKELTDSEVRRVLKTSKDSGRRRAVWEASKEVGAVVEADLRDLVHLRNDAARKLGFKNFHALQLYLNEQNSDDLIRLFDELDELTRGPFQLAKTEIDAKLAADCGIRAPDLMPWHYHDPFFQETPAVFATDLDAPFVQADLLRLCADFYRGIGLPIDEVIARSDLKEKPGKNPHAFCTDIDRHGDVRVLANVVNNVYWMSTLLHEFGHSVYSSKNILAELPSVLRMEAHILTTEGVAMMFERMSKRRAWLERMGVSLADAKGFDEAGAKALRYQLLIFSRWCQVMLRFEKAMYENPEQDLGKLWWDQVEKYQGVKRPPHRQKPDYASKIHICSAPVYYHNYMMGELFASQVHHTIAREVMKGAEPDSVIYVGNKEVGDFMRKRVFEPGRTLKWNALTKHATGEELNPKAFAADFNGAR